MAFAPKSQRLGEAILATLTASALFYFGNGLNPLWPLMWIAFLPVLLFALRHPAWAAAIVAIATALFGNLNLWGYLVRALGAPPIAWFSVFVPVAIVFALGVLLFRSLVFRGAYWSALVSLPAVWVTLEYVRNLTTPHGSAGSLAYSQLRFLPFLQLASITGPWGMTFALLLFSTALAIGFHLRRTDTKRSMQIAGAGIAIVGAVLLFGAIRLTIPQTQRTKVGLITSDAKPNLDVADAGADTDRLFHEYATQAQKLAAAGAQAIVMPEKLGVALEGKAADTDAIMQSIASQTGATLVAGVVHVDAPVKYNEARIYTPNAPLQRYDKEHMLPPFESKLKPGTTLVILPQRNQTWGVAICKDMDFSSPARRYGNAGAGLMLVPAWDFVIDGAWHGHIAIMRGVEDGFSIARAAKGGFLTVSDNRGRILGEVASNSSTFATLLVDVPTAHSWTIYQALGDWFAWIAIALLIVCAGNLARAMTTDSPKRRSAEPAF